jgi:pSer/pThr/pTyr-binding forkhead associated (FHA) protein
MNKWFWLKVKIDDPRYPRHGAMRVWRAALLFGWWLIGLYLGTVTINLIQVLRLGPEHITNRSELVPALLLPQFLADPSIPAIAFAPFALLFAALMAGGLWAARDIAAERAVRRAKEERREAELAQRAKDEGTGVMELETPSLHIISLDSSFSPRREPLLQDVVTVGRDTTNAIMLTDTRVGRKQMRLQKELYYWRVVSLRDKPELYVNGVKQTNIILRPHDQMIVGATMLRFNAPLPQTTTALAEQAPRLVVTCANVSFTAALRDPKIILGREVNCGIFVPSSIVSRHHADLIRTSEANYEIRDNGSENGLYFDGRRVSTHPLRHGDTITIGAGSGVDIVLLRYLAPEGLEASEVEIDAGELSPRFERIHIDGHAI